MATINTILSITDNISAQLNTIQGAVDNIKGSFTGLDGGVSGSEDKLNKFSWSTFLKNAEDAGAKIANIGQKMTLAITAPLVMLGKKLYNTATEHETAFVGMTKTVDGTAEQYEHLNAVAKEIAETTPMGYVDVMGTMQTGGNLGVKVDQMEAFARSYAALQSATDQKIAGEAGAGLVADFLTIMEGGVQRIEPFGSALVDLGNNFNATEDKILSMGKRMASAAVLAGFSTPQVLGMATAFSAVGIEAEAGGSAASKVIKQMQLSAEVGEKARQAFGGEFGSAIDFQNYLSTLQKADVVAIAEKMGTTADQVQSMADSWLSLEQFSQVSGKTADQFVKDWGNDPAQGMMDFFFGLNRMDTSGVESTLAMLDKMGITEVRQSNLVGAMAAKPELFAAALTSALDAYEKNTAMWAEFEKQTNTQESQNQMLGNKLENSMADLGTNLVSAVQPALDKVNELLTAFNNLSEADQDAIIKTFMIFAIGGPIVTAVGKTVETIGSIGGSISKIINSKNTWAPKLAGIFGSTAFWGIAAGVGILALISYLDSIPTKVEQIVTDLSGIKITVDDESVNATLAAIQKVQEAAGKLKGGGEASVEAQNTSAAVQMGYGTSTMYGTALGFEALMANTEVDQIIADYAGKIQAAEQTIINATTDAERAAGLATVQQLESDMKTAVQGARGRYATTISDLFNGMVGQYPEMADKLIAASTQYDLLAAFNQHANASHDTTARLKMGQAERDAYDAAWNANNQAMQDHILRLAADSGYLDGYTADQAIRQVNDMGTPFQTMMTGVIEKVAADLRDSTADLSQNPVLAGFLQSLISDPAVAENLDFTALQGGLDGIVGMLDFKAAAQAAVDAGKANEYGLYLTQGLAGGITANASEIAPGFTSIRDAALTALQTAFLMQSPSRLMAAQGIYIPQGLAQGILAGTSAVISAAISVARAGIRAAKAELGISSPSKIFEEIGAFTGQGFALGISSTAAMVGQAVETMTYSASESVWGLIDVFNDLEHQDMLGDGKELKVSDTDLRRIRDLAERQAINRFTTAELKVEFTANNTIKSDLDLDGIVSHLETVVEDTLMAAAEGVYA